MRDHDQLSANADVPGRDKSVIKTFFMMVMIIIEIGLLLKYSTRKGHERGCGV